MLVFSVPSFIRILLCAVWLAMFGVVFAQTYEQSVSAYEDKDYITALAGFKNLASQGHKEAQYYLGNMYTYGYGVPIDEVLAYEWFLKAATKGYAEAQFRIALDLDVGHKKVPAADAKKAAFWYLKAAEQGHAESQWILAYMFEHGHGVAKDTDKAFEWNLRAAEHGSPDMQAELANKYLLGVGTKKDTKTACIWFERSAKGGNSYSMVMTGYCNSDSSIGLVNQQKAIE